MFDRLFTLLDTFVKGNRRGMLSAVLLVTLASAVALFFTPFDGSIDRMLPPDREITRSMEFLRGSSFSDKIVLSLRLTDPSKGRKELFNAVDQLAASLKPPLFMKVVSGISLANVMDEFSVLQYAPQVLGPDGLEEIEKRINPQFVAGKMRSIYMQSMRPESVFTSSLSRSDPLDIKMLIFEKMRALPASMGYEVAVDDGHFISRDGLHSMMILHTSVPMMDSPRSKELLAALDERIKVLPPYIKVDILGGHLHTVSNEKVLKKDIEFVSTIASIAFLLLFLLVFRDIRVLYVFIIPFISIVWSLVIASAIEGPLMFMVMGMGTAIAGFSVDYGLHVYIAMKRGVDPPQFVKLARLVTVNGTTTVFSFIILYVSQIKGYHQLALFSTISVFLCMAFAIFLLPLMLGGMKKFSGEAERIDERLWTFRWPVKSSIALWAALFLLALYSSLSVTFDSDIKKLDGSEPKVIEAEKRFQDVWGGGKGTQAILVAGGRSLEEAMELNDRLFRSASGVIKADEFSSLAQFWPSQKARKENASRWDSFWKNGREERLKSLISQSSAGYGFSAEAFSPFFEGLYSHNNDAAQDSGVIAQLKERFITSRDGQYYLLSYFPDEQKYIDALKEITGKNPGTFVVSGRAMSDAISIFTAREVKILAPLAFLFNLLLVWIFFRGWRYTLVSMVPLVTGIVWFVGLMAFLKIPLNVINIVAAIISTGVLVDYGVGIAYQYGQRLRTGTIIAVSISAATNVIGTGALLFAKHPALHSTGVAMFICFITGYLSSLLVVPPLCSLLESRGGER